MSGPRDYTAATERALFALADLTCYYPGCEVQVVAFVESEPVVNVEIAHIRGANEGSPRYDQNMTDDERRAFANLILLCVPHHKYVDRLHIDRFPPDVLLHWKAEREKGRTTELGSIPTMTEERLMELLEEAVTAGAGQRVVTVELGFGMLLSSGEVVRTPGGDVFRLLVATQPDLGPQVSIVTIRNRGALTAFVENYELRFHPAGSALSGRNDFPLSNPRLPAKLESGEALHRFNDLAVLRQMILFHRERRYQIDSLQAIVSLGSGESIRSELESVDCFAESQPPDE